MTDRMTDRNNRSLHTCAVELVYYWYPACGRVCIYQEHSYAFSKWLWLDSRTDCSIHAHIWACVPLALILVLFSSWGLQTFLLVAVTLPSTPMVWVPLAVQWEVGDTCHAPILPLMTLILRPRDPSLLAIFQRTLACFNCETSSRDMVMCWWVVCACGVCVYVCACVYLIYMCMARGHRCSLVNHSQGPVQLSVTPQYGKAGKPGIFSHVNVGIKRRFYGWQWRKISTYHVYQARGRLP